MDRSVAGGPRVRGRSALGSVVVVVAGCFVGAPRGATRVVARVRCLCILRAGPRLRRLRRGGVRRRLRQLGHRLGAGCRRCGFGFVEQAPDGSGRAPAGSESRRRQCFGTPAAAQRPRRRAGRVEAEGGAGGAGTAVGGWPQGRLVGETLVGGALVRR